jgi:hypothetical protein
MADMSTDDLVNQLLTQTTVAPTPSVLGVQAPSDPSQLQALLGKLRQQQNQSQLNQPTPGEYGFLHDAGRQQFTQAGQMLGNMLQAPGGLGGPPPAQPQQAPFSVQSASPSPDGTSAPPAITPNPGKTPQQTVSNAVLAAKAYHASLIKSGTSPDVAQVQTLSKMEEWGVPGASAKLAAAQEQLLKNNKEVAEASKDTSQGAAAQDEIASRGIDQANRSRERSQEDTRLSIEQQNADTERLKANILASRGSVDLQNNPPTDSERIIAQKMADGDMAIPNVSARNPTGARLAALAFQLNPNLTQQLYATRQSAYKAIGSGKTGDQVRSFNVAYNHLGTLDDAIGALNNGGPPAMNKVLNTIATQTGQSAPTSFDTGLAMVKGELVKAIVGSHAGEEDRRNAMAGVNSASSPQQLADSIKMVKDLILGQASGIKGQFNGQLMGNGYKFEDALSPQFRSDFEQYQQTHNGKVVVPPKPTPAPTTPAASSSGWGPVQKVG